MKKFLVSAFLLCMVFSCAVSGRADGGTEVLSAWDVVSFGRYEQDNDTANGPEDIEWIILDLQDGNALLLSRYILDVQRFNKEYEPVTWEKCPLRSWLNNEFRNTAFTGEEQALLNKVTVAAPDKSSLKDGTLPGNDTQDEIFLLSCDECEQYFFGYNELMACPVSGYAAGWIKTDKSGCADWWLRTPGNTNKVAAYVRDSGELNRGGESVDFRNGVRPAIVIRESDIDPAKAKHGEYAETMETAVSAAETEKVKKEFEAERDKVRELCDQNYYDQLPVLPGDPVVAGKLVFCLRTEYAKVIDSLTELKYDGRFYCNPILSRLAYFSHGIYRIIGNKPARIVDR